MFEKVRERPDRNLVHEPDFMQTAGLVERSQHYQVEQINRTLRKQWCDELSQTFVSIHN